MNKIESTTLGIACAIYIVALFFSASTFADTVSAPVLTDLSVKN